MCMCESLDVASSLLPGTPITGSCEPPCRSGTEPRSSTKTQVRHILSHLSAPANNLQITSPLAVQSHVLQKGFQGTHSKLIRTAASCITTGPFFGEQMSKLCSVLTPGCRPARERSGLRGPQKWLNCSNTVLQAGRTESGPFFKAGCGDLHACDLRTEDTETGKSPRLTGQPD